MISVGFDASFADQKVMDTRMAFQKVKETMARIARRMPDVPFVLRPHPFENLSAYDDLLRVPNFQVRQEGTSLEWINGAKLLVHQNCSTAVESAMMGSEPISLEWFNTPVLLVPGPQRVSRHARSEEDLESMIRTLVRGGVLPPDAGLASARAEVVRSQYGLTDGRAAQRVAEAVAMSLAEPARPPTGRSPSTRAGFLHIARRILGPRAFESIRRGLSGPAVVRRQEAKHFALSSVQSVLGRLTRAAGESRGPAASFPSTAELTLPRLFSGQTVRVALT
jgi:hypothetical protein